MREVTSKEAAYLCRAGGFGAVAPLALPGGTASSGQSVNQLAQAFVEGLQVSRVGWVGFFWCGLDVREDR
jgi:hypothetical protein